MPMVACRTSTGLTTISYTVLNSQDPNDGHAWYVLSNVSYMNRVINDVLPTAVEQDDEG